MGQVIQKTVGGVRVAIKRGDAGLWYVTSPDVRGLLVAERSQEEAERAVPQALADLERARPL